MYINVFPTFYTLFYRSEPLRERALRIVLLWVNNHFDDFEK